MKPNRCLYVKKTYPQIYFNINFPQKYYGSNPLSVELTATGRICSCLLEKHTPSRSGADRLDDLVGIH